MNTSWSKISFLPDEQFVAATATAWKWLIPEPWRILVCSMFGGVFLEKESGGVFWLECGTGLVEHVAFNAEQFHAYLGAERDDLWVEQIDEWFLPGLVQSLLNAGKRPTFEECFGLTILPVFDGGRYEVDNVFILSARAWITLTGALHEQMRTVPDGARVEIKIVD